MKRIFLASALIAPLLSGCVIYANDEGKTDVVRLSDAASTSLEAVGEPRVENGRLTVRVGSNGCTSLDSFEVQLTEAADGYTDVVLNRRAPDMCKALVAEGVELSWSFATLDLAPDARLRLINPQTL
ncbi:hypothetical protein [Brevundimonas sp.]|uniref:hypothetical protein n=1 Tax=Brevundimonas sp. TaxID=1871086 RepID=UPI0035664C40